MAGADKAGKLVKTLVEIYERKEISTEASNTPGLPLGFKVS